MVPTLNILLINDSEIDAKTIIDHLDLSDAKTRYKRVATAVSMRSALDHGTWDMIISEDKLADFSAADALGLLQERTLDIPMIVICGDIPEETTADFLRSGASDCVVRDKLARLEPIVKRELRMAQARRESCFSQVLNGFRMGIADPENTEPYRSVVASMAEGVLIHDAGGKIISCNASAEAILGLSANQIMGKTPLDAVWRAIHEDGSPFPGETHPASITLRSGEPCANVIMGICQPDSRLRWISINSQPVFLPGSGKFAGVVATFTDITDQRQALEQVNKLNEALEKRVAERTAALEESHLRHSVELTALYNVISAAGQNKVLQERLDMALGEVLQSLNCSEGAIFLHDRDENRLLQVAGRIKTGILERIELTPIENTWEGWVILHEEVLIIPDISKDQRVLTYEDDPNAPRQIYIGMPIKYREKTTGVLSVLRIGEEIFDIEEITFISALANHIGVIIENNRLIDQIEKTALIEERSRLARELHDSVTQTLYSAAFFAEAGLDMAEQDNMEQVKENLAKLSQISQQALKEMRLLIYQLRPEILEKQGLFTAIQQRLELVENKIGIKTEFFTNTTSRMSRQIEDALYWTSVEALNNIVKHARADTIELRVMVEPRQVILSIVDNGIGFEPNSQSNSHGMGIANIKERIKKIGGRLEIKSGAGKGTCLTARCPLDSETIRALGADGQAKGK